MLHSLIRELSRHSTMKLKLKVLATTICCCLIIELAPLTESAALRKTATPTPKADPDVGPAVKPGERDDSKLKDNEGKHEGLKFEIEEEKGEIKDSPQLEEPDEPDEGHAMPDQLEEPNRGDDEKDNDLKPHELQLDQNKVLQKKITPLKIDDLQPPDHLDGVKMEQDGHLNKDYKKEILLGNHEEFENADEDMFEDKIKDVFTKMDTDKDHEISQTELEDWIVQKVEEHFDEAGEENERIFSHLDTDQDGYVSWQEFHLHFLLAKGHEQDQAEQHVVDYETIPLDPDDKERLIRYKFKWAEADDDPQDNKLTLEEFRSFRHPEQSKVMLNRMVQDILDNLDSNNDGKVTEKEFIALPPGDVDPAFQESDRLWQEERKKEFRTVIDLDRNGIVTREELQSYVDPKNTNHAKLEAENLIGLADGDRNNKLSIEEILENMELFLGSKVVDTGRSFHDEF